jgi:hypothetical protein
MTVLAAGSPLPGIGPFGAVVYALGSVALGALAFGHEFRHATMATLMASPVSRGHVLATKLAVLAILLAALGVVAWAHGGSASSRNLSLGANLLRSDVWFVLPLLCGLGLAPWFTLVTRSELAGMVFAGAVPAILLLAGDSVALMYYGLTPDRVDESMALRWLVVEVGVVVGFVTGLIGVTRTFQWFELVQGEPFTAWRAAAASGVSALQPSKRHHGPYRVLATKELRLQAPAVGIAAFFVAGWVAVSSAGDSVSARIDLDALRAGAAGLYAVLVALLIGALASAEERQQGTLSSQMLAPIAVWKQWSVKVGVIVGLTAVLAVAVPLLLAAATSGPRPWQGQVPVTSGLTLVLCLPMVGLYVSSLNTGGMRAFLASVGGLVAFWPAVWTVYDSHLVRLLVLWFASLSTILVSPEDLMNARAVLVTWVWPVLFVILLLLLGRFAMNNHRRMDLTPSGVGRQLGWFAAILALVVLCDSAAGGLFRAAMDHRARTVAAPSRTE